MCEKSDAVKLIKECNVVYTRVPALYKKPTIIASKPTVLTDHGTHLNECIYVASVDENWRRDMEKSGFAVKLELSPKDSHRGWTLADNKAKWDKDMDKQDTCKLTYTEEAYPNKLEPALKAEVKVYLPEQGDLYAEVKEVPSTKKGAISTWESKVHRNDRIASSESKEVLMTPKQLEKLTTSDTYKLDWNDSPPLKKSKGALAKKLMSNMVIRHPLTIAPSIAINSNGKSAVKSVPPDYYSIKQVLDLGATIEDLNGPSYKLNLKSVIPEASW